MKLNQRIGLALTAGLLGISLVPITTGAAASETVDKPVQVLAQTTEKVVVTDPTVITRLNNTSVTPLIVEAEKRFFYAMGGGTASEEGFELNGQQYRYVSDDIGTRAKLMDYLKQVYTEKAAAYFVDKYFITHDGRLAQLNADAGNILEYNKATAKMLSMTATQRVYKLSVPYPEHNQGPKYIVVKFEKVGDFWRVGTAPHAIF
ncbi:DL-endopeptidase inhibitor IseA family protein [Paenibacillus dokdonensis]|uniref:DL-endopeptidase inhibitor IseA family protein n=1 Tax=Paenibacillus dokdonensis TaxID=2567944 RepID=A0ABU6GMN2_9BACL|nr:DL-endopeptidase inhibitor IseA family protein [Paenibacillus dokdonensis]MEC0239501.1 DL-endopeptidase inhibitor IseA family protein [Paenibacillus dokdonensis]